MKIFILTTISLGLNIRQMANKYAAILGRVPCATLEVARKETINASDPR